eukprot:m.296294 g.296294  ORF g.296294 m.296294 type:complete len:81 (-) comp13362_c0_seq1:1920-2162(-)
MQACIYTHVILLLFFDALCISLFSSSFFSLPARPCAFCFPLGRPITICFRPASAPRPALLCVSISNGTHQKCLSLVSTGV